MMSEADDAFLHVHLDHVQLKSQSQDYAITSGSAICSQNSNCARTWANSNDAEKRFVPRPLAKGHAYQKWVLEDKSLDKHYARCVACSLLLWWSLQNLTLVLTSPCKVIIWLSSKSLGTMIYVSCSRMLSSGLVMMMWGLMSSDIGLTQTWSASFVFYLRLSGRKLP